MPSPFSEQAERDLAHYREGDEPAIIATFREAIGRRQDGSTFPIELAVSAFTMGHRRHLACIVRDISEHKRAEQVLREASNELRRSNLDLETFTYSVSHDLKEPLRTLEGFSQFLLEDYGDKLDDEGKSYLTKLAQASSRMKHLIDDLLTLSLVGRQTDAPVLIDVDHVVADVVEGLRVMIGERAATVDVAQHLPAAVADPRRLEQIFGNLVANAIKFNHGIAPRVEIGAFVNDAGITTFFVRDNGIGIESAYQEKIFGLFQRLHRREDYEGTGAGLAIVRRAVEALGGTVWVESTVGEGSTFMFTLPVCRWEHEPTVVRDALSAG